MAPADLALVKDNRNTAAHGDLNLDAEKAAELIRPTVAMYLYAGCTQAMWNAINDGEEYVMNTRTGA